MNIFLCHSHSDKPFVRKLASDLESDGFKVWVAEAEIRAGESLIKKITEGLKSVDLILAILSENSINSSWVKQELQFAILRQIEEKKALIIPILIHEVEPPYFLLGKKHIKFIQDGNYLQSLNDLINDLKIIYKSNTPQSFRIYLNHNGIRSLKKELINNITSDNNFKLYHSQIDESTNNWNRNFFEGYISSCKCFIDIIKEIQWQEFSDENMRETLITFIPHFMGIYCQNILDNVELMGIGEAENQPHYKNFDDFWKISEFKASHRHERIIIKYCPSIDYKSFYLGWKMNCIEFAENLDLEERKEKFKAEQVLEILYRIIYSSLLFFEQQYYPDSFVAWHVVRMYLQSIFDLINDEEKKQFYAFFPNFEVDALLENQLYITETLKDLFKHRLDKFEDKQTAMVINLLELQTRFKYSGTDDPNQGMEIKFEWY